MTCMTSSTMTFLSSLLPFDRDIDVPGTEQLVDVHHNLDAVHSGSEIVLIPPPTACEGDPLRWRRWKKYWHLFLVSTYACIFSFAENNTGDAWTTIVDMTGSTMNIMNGGGALNYLLLGLVNIFWIPAAMKFGRRPCFLLTLLLCTGSSIWIACFHTVGEWYGSNIINGLGTSAYEAVIQLVVFDLFFVHERGRMLAVYIFAQQLGSIIGLVSGGYIADGPGWRWSQWIVTIGEGTLIGLFFLTYEETLFPRFLFSQNLPTVESTSAEKQTASLEADSSSSGQPVKEDEKDVVLDCEEGIIDPSEPSPSEFPKRTWRQKLKLWTYYPQDRTTYWAYFKRPFFLVAFPNVVIVCTRLCLRRLLSQYS